MIKIAMVFVVGLVVGAAFWLLPASAQESESCDEQNECAGNGAPLLRCETVSDGGIEVKNWSVTSDLAVEIEAGDSCVQTISDLLGSNLKVAQESITTSGTGGTPGSFNCIFLGNGNWDDSRGDDRDDDNDD